MLADQAPPPAIVAPAATPDHSARNKVVKEAIEIPVAEIQESPLNPRRFFDAVKMDGLRNSIILNGVEDPITVRFVEDSHFSFYEIADGARRFRAATAAGLTGIPCYVEVLTDKELLQLAYRKNTERDGLTPMENARYFRTRLDMDFGLTQVGLAGQEGTTQSEIAKAIGLLRLPEDVQAMVDDRRLSEGVAVVLIPLSVFPEACIDLALRAVSEGLTQRAVEQISKETKGRLDQAKREAEGQLGLPLQEEKPAAPATQETPTTQADAFDPDGPQTLADALAEGDLGESDLVDDDAPAAAESDDETFPEAPTGEETAGIPTAAAPAPPKTAPAAPAAATKPSTSTVPPTPAPAPVVDTTPSAAPGAMIAATIRQSDDDWLYDNNLTISQVFDSYRALQAARVAQIAPSQLGHACIKAVNQRYNEEHPNAPVSLDRQLGIILLEAAKTAGFDIDDLSAFTE